MTLRNASIGSLFTATLCAAGVASTPAHAQYFSNHDGYTDDGQYRVQAELSPYLWLPATSGSIGFAHPDIASRITSGNFNTPVPSISNLAQSLHFSFMGAGVLRYGPYSAEVDLQYVNASQSKTLLILPQGQEARVKASADYLRIAPGLGYQVFSGDIAGIPASADARVGFAYFTSSQSLKGEGILTGEVKGSDDFIQPWAGLRFDLIPSPRWRLELNGLVQGMGVEGSWGWGASGIVSYAITDLIAVDFGARALETERERGHRDTLAAGKRSYSLVAYGPLVGISFRLGSSPPPLPAPTPAPVAAPAPVPAKTYLVFFDWDKANLTPRATEIIAQAATQSKSQSTTTIAVNGYTDTSGTAVYNQGLSVRRAKAVAAQLVADGVPESEITAQGFGDTHLLVPTGPGVREPQNRRVAIILQ